MNLVRHLTSLTIRTKLMCGFGVVLVLFAIVGGASLRVFGHVDEADHVSAQRRQVLLAVGAIGREFEPARRLVRRFAEIGGVTAAEEANAQLARAAAAGAAAIATIRNPDRLAKAREIAATIADYTQQFGRLQEVLAAARRVRDAELDPAGASLTEEFETMMAAVAATQDAELQALAFQSFEAMMVLRVDANRALGRHQEAETARADASFARLQASLAKLTEATRDPAIEHFLASLGKTASAYGTAFHRLLAATGEINRMVNGSMAADGQRITEAILLIEKSALADATEADRDITETIAAGTTLIAILGIAGLAIGVLFAWMIGTAIARPVAGMTGAMIRLADSDATVEVPGIGRKDEIGRMAQAVQVFKDNMLRAVALEQTQQEERVRKDRRQAAMDQHTKDFGSTVSHVLSELQEAAVTMRQTAEVVSADAR
ncbi:MAG: HAMP domain-containing protein, partial [Rhodospirillales bacterium]|nr:HAMP domain-containing protein [Rhodospirillales bacterium]